VLCVLKDNNFFRRTKMKRQSILVLVFFVLVAAPATAIIWTQVVPKYQAKAEVRVRPIIPYLVFKTEDNGMIPFYESFVNTQVSIIRSQAVLQRALDRREIRETQWYKKPQIPLVQGLRDNPPTLIERLQDTLSVKPRPQTEIIDVSFTDPSAKDARIIVDAVLEEYIKYIGEKTNADEDKLFQQLTEQYRSLQNQIQGQERISAQLHESLGTQKPQELISGKRLHLDQTQARLSELQQRIAILEWDTKQAVAGDINMAIEKQPKYHIDAEWRKQDVEVRTIRHNIDVSGLKPTNPDIVRSQKDLAFAEELLKLRESQLDEQWRDRPRNVAGAPTTIDDAGDPNYVKGMIEHQLARAKHEERLLSDQYRRQQAEFKKIFENAQLLEKENNSLLHKRELLNAVRRRLDQKNMERNIPGPIEVMHASVSSKPYKDRRIMFTAIALVLGLGIGLCVRFLFRRRARSGNN
jgi:uncharacterized protein involved in exopolysaccharide biosynthesis